MNTLSIVDMQLIKVLALQAATEMIKDRPNPARVCDLINQIVALTDAILYVHAYKSIPESQA